MRIIILAAGVGSRLGRPIPKPLTTLADGETILARQLRLLREGFDRPQISIVVGFKKDMIMEAHPDVGYVYNERFGETNTSKSLLHGLAQTGDEPVLWMNGDVVFDESILPTLTTAMSDPVSFVAVNHAEVDDEEVKYTLGDDGAITALSKAVPSPVAQGEAVGINHVAATDKARLVERLAQVADDDYFERGIEMTIELDDARWVPLDVAGFCVEVDFESDLRDVNRQLTQGTR